MQINIRKLFDDSSLYNLYKEALRQKIKWKNVTPEQLEEQKKYFNLALQKYLETLERLKTLKEFNEEYSNLFYDHSFIKKFMDYFGREVIRTLFSPGVQEKKEDLIKKVASNYVINVAEAIKRTVNHFADIKQLLKINESQNIFIKKIKVTDSDPHKNGKQVVILTLEETKTKIQSIFSFFGWTYEYKIVYKPANLNVDKLLVGHKQSIAEFLNDSSTKELYLSTYEILPCDDRYGFMKCLSHKEQDYKNPNQKQFEKFSQAFGSLSALATVFGIDDRLPENVLVQNFFPYFIDSETSFSTKACEHLENTLITNILGSLVPGANLPISIKKADDLRHAGIYSVLIDEENNFILASEKKFSDGFTSTMKAIAANGTKIIQMIKNSENIRVRYVPINTPVFNTFKEYTFNQEKLTKEIQKEILGVVVEGLTQLSDESSRPTKENINKSDLFFMKILIVCYLNVESMCTDFMRGDIPYFSVDINSGKIYDSNNKELKWDEEGFKLLLKLLNDIHGINEKKTNKILNLFKQLKSPAQTVIECIRKLQKEYQENNEDITKCTLCIENMKKIQAFFNKAKQCELQPPKGGGFITRL